jgi:hypothetical protein
MHGIVLKNDDKTKVQEEKKREDKNALVCCSMHEELADGELITHHPYVSVTTHRQTTKLRNPKERA